MGKVKKEVRRGLRSFDQRVGFTAQKRILSSGFKALTGKPKIVQPSASTGSYEQNSVRPLAAVTQSGDNQEEVNKDLYRRRRARGIATNPMGLTGSANVKRKTLLGG